MMDTKKYNLLDNSYNFINEAILNARKAKRNSRYWAFAILHLIQGLELLLKSILREEHPVLIYENIDNPKYTVSLTQALNRLIAISQIDIDEKEKRIIKRAINQRNMIVHYEYDLKPPYSRNVFIQIFEFIHYFHHKHIGKELHEFIDNKLWRAEAELLAEFRKKWVVYRGQKVFSGHPIDIVTAQKYNSLRLSSNGDYKYYKRYKYGDEPGPFGPYNVECHDCAVEVGEYHTFGCDMEWCPICDSPLFGCMCEAEYWIQKDSTCFEEAYINTEQRITQHQKD